VTIVHYLVAHEHDRRRARHAIDRLLSVFAVAAVDDAVIRAALRLGWADFEDAVTAAAAASAGCDALVTRNPRDFKGSPVPVIDAATALALVLSGE
jgi:predicted nucleic acid-binding protein